MAPSGALAARVVQELIDTAAPRTDLDRRAARAAACYAPRLVVDHIGSVGLEDAKDLYGRWMTLKYHGLAASSCVRFGTP